MRSSAFILREPKLDSALEIITVTPLLLDSSTLPDSDISIVNDFDCLMVAGFLISLMIILVFVKMFGAITALFLRGTITYDCPRSTVAEVYRDAPL